MRILITGGSGQLGQALTHMLHEKHELLPCTHSELEITDYAACRHAIRTFGPDLVLHAAAWTDVDGCERHPTRCVTVNAGGAWNVAAAAAEGHAAFGLISTDYVFDGRFGVPLPEHHPTNPLSAYGMAKDWAETYCWEANPQTFIFRTQWLYAPGHRNFATAILHASTRPGPVRVVADQIGVPTSCAEAARQIARIIATPRYGTYHVNNDGQASWFGFATELFLGAGVDPGRLQPISAREWDSPVERPAYSVLRRSSQQILGLDAARSWQEDARQFGQQWRTAQETDPEPMPSPAG